MGAVAFEAVQRAVPDPNQGPGHSERVLRLLERVDYRRAETTLEREAIYKLRYAAYLREGAIPADPSERFSDSLDETDNALIFAVHVDGELASSIRLHVASREHPQMPALNVFADLLSPVLAAGRTVIDPTRFVADRAGPGAIPNCAT